MYKRDFAVLLLSICAVYLSLQNEGPFTYKKAWYHHFALDDEALSHAGRLPAPIVADLNGDGKPEVIVAAPGSRLLVLAPRRPGDGFAAAQVLSSLSLPAPVVALRTGHLTRRPNELVRVPRKQVVVVVTAALEVRCLDHNLKLLWVRSLADHFQAGGAVHEVAVMVTDHTVTKGDRGMVVVGASMPPQTLAVREEEGDVLQEELLLEKAIKARARGRAASGTLGEVGGTAAGGGSGRHFSYFALEGGTGEVRWKHEALDFHRNLTTLRESTVRTQHGLHDVAQMEEGIHYGEASCREYREAVLASLPHSWNSPLDTSLHLAHFHKHRASRGAQKERLSTLAATGGRPQRGTPPKHGGGMAHSSPGARNPVGHVLGSLVKGATRTGGMATAAAAHPHHTAPNVVVAHLEEGLEAVHLFSGRPVCRLHLASPGLHVDLNGDGIPDHVHAIGGDPADLALEGAEEDADRGHRHHRLAYCAAVVSTGIPPTEHLFNGTICRRNRAALRRAPAISSVEVAPPVVLPAPGRRGFYHVPSLRQKGIAVFMTNRGELTAYDSRGVLLWQAFAGTSWQAQRRGGDLDEDDDDDAGEGDNLHRHQRQPFTPTLAAMALRRHAVPTVLLAAGQHDATVVSEHGNELAWLSLPESPTQPLVVLDFNFDGYNDILMVGHEGVYAWAQVRRPGAVPFSALVGGLIVIMVAVFVVQQGFVQQAGKPKGRSTERLD